MLDKKALAVDSTVPTISALILMDNEGKRIAVDYFTDKLYVTVYVMYLVAPDGGTCLNTSLHRVT